MKNYLLGVLVALITIATPLIAPAAEAFYLNAEIGHWMSETQKVFVPGLGGYSNVAIVIQDNSQDPRFEYTIVEAQFSNMYGSSQVSWAFKANLVKKDTRGTYTFNGVQYIPGRGDFENAVIKVSKPNRDGIGTIEMKIGNYAPITHLYRNK